MQLCHTHLVLVKKLKLSTSTWKIMTAFFWGNFLLTSHLEETPWMLLLTVRLWKICIVWCQTNARNACTWVCCEEEYVYMYCCIAANRLSEQFDLGSHDYFGPWGKVSGESSSGIAKISTTGHKRLSIHSFCHKFWPIYHTAHTSQQVTIICLWSQRNFG